MSDSKKEVLLILRAQTGDLNAMDALPDSLAEPLDEAEGEAGILALANPLPPGSRAVVPLHYQEEMSLQTVANVLGLPLGTVKSRLSYGLAALRSTIKQ